ncbi:MAG: hypothetical protein PHP23_15915 [Desulfobacterales bacterium]|nr:hypothetical protein [Desulfobacterales bacterium]MDD4073059.1 hypothetical protein [Desulfobacterales bacterium]MDD4394142.1 hypothetical protein [Desulfobacterales bacterium]
MTKDASLAIGVAADIRKAISDRVRSGCAFIRKKIGKRIWQGCWKFPMGSSFFAVVPVGCG